MIMMLHLFGSRHLITYIGALGLTKNKQRISRHIPYRNIFRRSTIHDRSTSTMSDEIKRNQPIDRHTFIDEKKSIEAAFSKGTWFVVGKDGESVDEEPIPESIKAAGKIPEGYALDHVLDPSTVISALAKSDITTIDQLPNETLESIKESINSVGNVFLVPIDVVEQKRKATEGALEEMAENPEKMPQDSDTNNTINVEAVHDKVFDNILK